MTVVLTLILGLLVGFILGAYFVIKNKTEILKRTFADMTKEEVVMWWEKKYGGGKV